MAIALGVGANTAIFSVVNKVLLEPLPCPEPGRLVQLISSWPLGDQYVVAIPKYITWRDNTHDFEAKQRACGVADLGREIGHRLS